MKGIFPHATVRITLCRAADLSDTLHNVFRPSVIKAKKGRNTVFRVTALSPHKIM
jgi:hypothetical protein